MENFDVFYYKRIGTRKLSINQYIDIYYYLYREVDSDNYLIDPLTEGGSIIDVPPGREGLKNLLQEIKQKANELVPLEKAPHPRDERYIEIDITENVLDQYISHSQGHLYKRKEAIRAMIEPRLKEVTYSTKIQDDPLVLVALLDVWFDEKYQTSKQGLAPDVDPNYRLVLKPVITVGFAELSDEPHIALGVGLVSNGKYAALSPGPHNYYKLYPQDSEEKDINIIFHGYCKAEECYGYRDVYMGYRGFLAPFDNIDKRVRDATYLATGKCITEKLKTLWKDVPCIESLS